MTHVESIAIENCVLLQKSILIVDKTLLGTVYPSDNKGWSLNSNMKAVVLTFFLVLMTIQMMKMILLLL